MPDFLKHKFVPGNINNIERKKVKTIRTRYFAMKIFFIRSTKVNF